MYAGKGKVKLDEGHPAQTNCVQPHSTGLFAVHLCDYVYRELLHLVDLCDWACPRRIERHSHVLPLVNGCDWVMFNMAIFNVYVSSNEGSGAWSRRDFEDNFQRILFSGARDNVSSITTLPFPQVYVWPTAYPVL